MPDDARLPGQARAGAGPFDYALLARENERRYGTDIGRIGTMLLADRYDDRTHFIYELLQNAEDALRRRSGWAGRRSVRFELSEECLRVSHFGKPFDEPDVRGICGIDESTKDLTAIGRFGIGFKSVYAFADRPEVHSGLEDFVIESFVRPVATEQVDRDPDETVIVIPLRTSADLPVITAGLAGLGPSALLFLREVDQIEWSVQGGPSGIYLRGPPVEFGEGVRQVKVIGERAEQPEIEEDWLLFSRSMRSPAGDHVGYVEIAFHLELDALGKIRRVRPIPRSPLSVYFPTVVETHFGFLLQGPLRTTPSRDNVPKNNEWNLACMAAAADLLAETLHWLRGHGMLDAAVLGCLPIDRNKFPDGSMFAATFEKVKSTLSEEPLLPAHQPGHLSAKQAFLARTQDLRDLLDAAQLGELFADGTECGWLSGEITQDRAPELRQYLMRELGIAELTPESMLSKLDTGFLERQSDIWIEHLYVFLNGQAGLRVRAAALPLVRLTDGSHVRPYVNGVPQAFLAGSFETGFPTVRPQVCAKAEARAFLGSLGLTEPDRVDDVIWNVLPKYGSGPLSITSDGYAADIVRILAAYKSDSKAQQEKLLKHLREASFVMSVSASDGRAARTGPGNAFLATERLKELLTGIKGAYIVDERHRCLRGEEARDLLEACGAARHLRLLGAPALSWAEQSALRAKTGHVDSSGINDRVADLTLFGLNDIIAKLATLDADGRRRQAELLWEELGLIEERRGKGVFTSDYSWTHHGSYRTTFEAAFIRTLNKASWVPGPDGELYPPGMVLFESLGWKPSPFLLSQIHFKPPIIAQLAKEAGFEPGVLDLLMKLGVTSEAELRTRLGIKEPPASTHDTANDGEDGATDRDADGDTEAHADSAEQRDRSAESPASPGGQANPGSNGQAGGSAGGPQSQPLHGTAQPVEGQPIQGPLSESQQQGTPGQGAQPRPESGEPESNGHRPFISFVGLHPEKDGPDPDNLTQEARMALEEAAIAFILSQEPVWKRAPPGNPGFDLYKAKDDGAPYEWCEVKAMTGSLDDHPVGISRTQFQFARERGDKVWLYVVERAATETGNIVRIKDPAGQARTFTFDHGWRAVSVPLGDGT